MAISVDTDERQKRAAQNQALFREINESLKALNENGVSSRSGPVAGGRLVGWSVSAVCIRVRRASIT
jgi:hypothetical protein